VQVLRTGQIVVAGGTDAAGPMNSVEMLDVASGDGWQQLPPLAVPRADCAVAQAADGRLVVAGGHDGSEPLSCTEVRSLLITSQVAALPRLTPCAHGWQVLGIRATGAVIQWREAWVGGGELVHPRSGHCLALLGANLVRCRPPQVHCRTLD